jgi:hypothetical protein
MEWSSIVTTIGLSIPINGVIIFCFKEAVKGSIKKDLNLQKAKLDDARENLKHELEKEILRARFSTEKQHVIYPEMYRLLRVAAGSIGRFYNIAFTNNFDDFNTEDLTNDLRNRKIPEGAIQKLLAAVQNGRTAGLKEIERYLYQQEFVLAQMAITEAKNFLLLQELYMTTEIAEDGLSVCKGLQLAWIGAQNSGNAEQGLADYNQASDKLDEMIPKIKAAL